MIAFITDRYDRARIDIRSDYEVTSTKGGDRGTLIWEGADMPFLIVTRPEQLRGCRLHDYVALTPNAQMEAIARAMIR